MFLLFLFRQTLQFKGRIRKAEQSGAFLIIGTDDQMKAGRYIPRRKRNVFAKIAQPVNSIKDQCVISFFHQTPEKLCVETGISALILFLAGPEQSRFVAQ